MECDAVTSVLNYTSRANSDLVFSAAFIRSFFFTIYSHSPNFNAKGAFLPRPCPRCSSKFETTISVLSSVK